MPIVDLRSRETLIKLLDEKYERIEELETSLEFMRKSFDVVNQSKIELENVLKDMGDGKAWMNCENINLKRKLEKIKEIVTEMKELEERIDIHQIPKPSARQVLLIFSQKIETIIREGD